jgi:hypothetical protein
VPLIAHIVGDEPVVGTHRGYFSDVGASMCAWLGVVPPAQLPGVSFIDASVIAR